MFLVLLLVSSVASSAGANDSLARLVENRIELSPELRTAEYARLSGEMRSLSRRSAWTGVDRTYMSLVGLNSELAWEDHILGAQASSELGRISDTHERLLEAVRLDPNPEIVDWLWSIDQSYGRVVFVSEPGSLLDAMQVSLDPVERRAVEFAIASCERMGTFEGLLPAGNYVFDGRPVEVEVGSEIMIDLASETRQRNRFGLYR